MSERKVRVRRGRDEARLAILEAAAKRLREGGPAAVRVQHVAADLGVSDAAIHHHFGSREGLMESLLRFAGQQLRDELARGLADWDGDPAGLRPVIERIADVYGEQGHARLAIWLAENGRSSKGRGLFEPLVDVLQAARLRVAREQGRRPPRRRDAQYDVALLNVVLAGEPLFGPSFLRSVGLDDDATHRARFRRFVIERSAEALTEEIP